MMWKYHLGHPNFPYLRMLIPLLFVNKNAKLFQCAYQLSKHTHDHNTRRPHTPYKPIPSFTGIFGNKLM